MDKNAIKKYAIWARRELIEKVSQKALQYGIEDGKELDPKLESINGVLLSDDEKKQRQALIRKINENGYAHVMEEVAYTWFNRFIALRFMEVNGYLPSHVRVFTDEAGEFKPQIMSEALHLELEGLDMEKVYELKNDNRDDDLFKYLLITQCNALSGIFPKMFQKIADYTELLLPDYLLREGSVIEQMVNQKDGIPEADWQDQVQIIGWLYQFYNVEPKAKAISHRGKKISKDELPAATQLFTPDWIVHYMVENSLGRLWLEGHPNDSLKSDWKYYINEAEQESDVQKQLDAVHEEYAGLKPEEIKCIDPCMGSGHILCVLFDTLIKIYEDYGYSVRDAAISIVENNLWGLDIDERAAQLAYFTVMMKARQYDRRFLTRGIQPHVYAIEESNGLKYDGDYGDFLLDKKQQETLSYMMDIFKDAKEYGSLLSLEKRDFDSFIDAWRLTAEQTLNDVRMMGWYMYAGERITTLAYQAKALSQDYQIVVTNPPYLGVSDLSSKLGDFIKSKYPEGKADLFSAFIERCATMTRNKGFYAMITMHSWMFLSSFEELRIKMEYSDFVNMVHLGAHAFEEIGGEVVQTTSFVIRKTYTNGYKGIYFRLLEESTQDAKEEAFLRHDSMFVSSQDKYKAIPGAPVAYWVEKGILDSFESGTVMGKIAEIVTGMSTGNNDLYLRLWTEVDVNRILFRSTSFENVDLSISEWVPYNKGGEARKWYGNNEYIVKWSESAHFHRARPTFSHLYLKQGITWSFVTSGMFSARYYPNGFLWDVAGCPCVIQDEGLMYYALGYLSTKIANQILKIINPTINCQVIDVQRTPIIIDEEKKDQVIELSKSCVDISKNDWDSFENSWDFMKNPLVPMAYELEEQKKSQFASERMKKYGLISWHYDMWKESCEDRFLRLKDNEQKLNDIFIKIFKLSDSMTSEVPNKDVTVRRADLSRDIRGLISYAVGCMFGRYSIDSLGLIYAGGIWDMSKYATFMPDKDAIIPICDDEYFSDDIVGRFIEFIEVVYGKELLEDNLQFIADALGGNGTSREVIRNYFINDFYADHVKIYQKRPIYWLFDSGKKNGFKCLVYMHRYQPDTIARIRTDYVHEQQARYKTAIEEIEKRIDTVSASEKVKLTKKLNTLKAQDEEIHTYEEKIHHLADQMISIDLDDGVKHNYELFQDVLAKIK